MARERNGYFLGIRQARLREVYFHEIRGRPPCYSPGPEDLGGDHRQKPGYPDPLLLEYRFSNPKITAWLMAVIITWTVEASTRSNARSM